MDDSLRYHLALTCLPGIGPVVAKNLIAYCGQAREVFRSSGRRLRRVPGIGPALARNILEGRTDALRAADRELDFLERHPDIRALTFLDEAFPERLKQIPDSPTLLFFRGAANLNARRMLAMVGTRRPGTYGRLQAERLVRELQPYGVCVISGLAYGIDAIVHRTCLECSLPTIGVMGTGFGRIYPAAHRGLASRMLEQGGLLTEFRSRFGPEKEHFPMRNRIVAGMCDALLVVATGTKGGSMISANLANDYHRDVFALPGAIGKPDAAGCHALIKTHRAGLIEGAEDLAYRLGWDEPDRPLAQQASLFDQLSETERQLAAYLAEQGETHIDTICRKFHAGSATMAALLLNLECQGVVKALPGHRYTLLRR